MRCRWTLTLLAYSATALAHAQPQQMLYSASLAASCAACHGTQGRPVEHAAVPPLAGTSAAAIVQQMQAFKAGTRPSTVMQQISKGYSDAQIAQIAAYFADQRP